MKKRRKFELYSLILSLVVLVGILSFFGIMALGFGDFIDLPESLSLFLHGSLALILILSYISGLIAIVEKIQKKKVDIWMVIISYIINSQLLYFLIFALMFIGSTTGGSF